MKKPDRFEREAYKLTVDLYAQADIHGDKLSIGKIDCVAVIARMLRREHAWVKKMVKSHMESMVMLRSGIKADGNESWMNGYRMACEEFLSQLAQRRK